jgi:hypothetical protein
MLTNSCRLLYAGFWLDVFFSTEDEGDISSDMTIVFQWTSRRYMQVNIITLELQENYEGNAI